MHVNWCSSKGVKRKMELKSWFECMTSNKQRRKKSAKSNEVGVSNWSIGRQNEWIVINLCAIHHDTSHGKLNIMWLKDGDAGKKKEKEQTREEKKKKTILTFWSKQTNYMMIKFIRRKDAHSEWTLILSFLQAIFFIWSFP